MDLANLSEDDISFAEMAQGLSKIARFNGRHPGPPLSVGQHCVMGADAIFTETGDSVMAGFFLLHDGHEYLLGDTPSPAARLYDHFHRKRRLVPSHYAPEPIRDAIAAAKFEIDLLVWKRAGLPRLDRMPIAARTVAAMDGRMMRAEALALFGAQAAANVGFEDLPPPRLKCAIRPWGACKAEEAFLERLSRYLGIEERPA